MINTYVALEYATRIVRDRETHHIGSFFEIEGDRLLNLPPGRERASEGGYRLPNHSEKESQRAFNWFLLELLVVAQTDSLRSYHRMHHW